MEKRQKKRDNCKWEAIIVYIRSYKLIKQRELFHPILTARDFV